MGVSSGWVVVVRSSACRMAESVAARADSMSGHITLMALRWLLGTTSRMLKLSAGISQANSVESPSPAFLVAGCAGMRRLERG